MSTLAAARVPFLFITTFRGDKVLVYPLADIDKHNIRYSFSNFTEPNKLVQKISYSTAPVGFEVYQQRFAQVVAALQRGDTYLLNLTQPTVISTPLTLTDIYDLSAGPFRLQVGEQFMCASPERFITIADDKISTFPMKGTIDAALPAASTRILNDPKEIAEHTMVVDLLRNDLCQVATNVRVEKFRYLDQIRAGEKDLLQVSSQITADLPSSWREQLGQIMARLLPAGSITGTPKSSTVALIEQIEGYRRGYFTGVFGVYDGDSVESAVMIRFLERDGDRLVYKSGGGITIDSDPETEYQELLDKIYLA